MTVIVIEPPEPLFSPADIPGATADMIAAVVGELDGPTGWLGRALGPQTLEFRPEPWRRIEGPLPYAPIIDVVSVIYFDVNEVEQTVDPALYGVTNGNFFFKRAWPRPVVSDEPDAVRIRYRAGYDGTPVNEGGTGAIPPQIKQAVTLSVQYLKALSSDNLFLQQDEVEGVGRKQYVVSAVAGQIIEDAANRLLSGLRLY